MLQVVKEFEGWPSGKAKEIMFLKISPHDVAKTLGSILDRANDDLGWFTVTFFEAPEVGPIIIYMYDSNLGSSTVSIDEGADAGQAEEQIIKGLKLRPDDVCWRLSLDGQKMWDECLKYSPERES